MTCGTCEVFRGESASDVEDTQIYVGVFRQRNSFTDCDSETVQVFRCSACPALVCAVKYEINQITHQHGS